MNAYETLKASESLREAIKKQCNIYDPHTFFLPSDPTIKCENLKCYSLPRNIEDKINSVQPIMKKYNVYPDQIRSAEKEKQPISSFNIHEANSIIDRVLYQNISKFNNVSKFQTSNYINNDFPTLPDVPDDEVNKINYAAEIKCKSFIKKVDGRIKSGSEHYQKSSENISVKFSFRSEQENMLNDLKKEEKIKELKNLIDGCAKSLNQKIVFMIKKINFDHDKKAKNDEFIKKMMEYYSLYQNLIILEKLPQIHEHFNYLKKCKNELKKYQMKDDLKFIIENSEYLMKKKIDLMKKMERFSIRNGLENF